MKRLRKNLKRLIENELENYPNIRYVDIEIVKVPDGHYWDYNIRAWDNLNTRWIPRYHWEIDFKIKSHAYGDEKQTQDLLYFLKNNRYIRQQKNNICGMIRRKIFRYVRD